MTNFDRDELKRHVSDKDTWMRFLFLVIFWAAFYIVATLTFAISLFQFLAKLFGGHNFPGLAEFGDNLASYQGQLVRFLTFSSDERPFPFAPFPDNKITIITPTTEP
jgi:hypothetical protein